MTQVSPAYRPTAQARLALVQGTTPQRAGVPVPADAMSDAGYVYNLTRYFRTSGQPYEAVNLLASRAAFTTPAFDGTQFISEALAVAKGAGATQAVSIASKVDDVFAPGTDISDGSFTLRDKYTDLMWLGGTKALWSLGDGTQAAPLFYRYGTAAKTPLTRSKGFTGRSRGGACGQQHRSAALLGDGCRISRLVLWPARAERTRAPDAAIRRPASARRGATGGIRS